jgi:hemerythrin
MLLCQMTMAQASLSPPLLSCDPSSGPFRWPRRWEEQRQLLERQHERLEWQLAAMIRAHGVTAEPLDRRDALDLEHGCRRLLRLLGLHLRLEERFLSSRGCLCQGHRAHHRQAAREATAGLQRSKGDPAARLALLLAIHGWFHQHMSRSDAIAYAMAEHRGADVEEAIR